MRMMLTALALLTAAPVLAEPPRVVVDTPVSGSLVQQVMGEGAEVTVLLPQGASAHHHQMRPSDAQGLQDAELLVWTGPELTPWLDRSSASLAQGAVHLRLLEVPGTHLRSYAGEHEAHDHGHDDGHDQGDADLDDVDPHAWLDPANAQLWLTAVAETLSQADPANAARYAQNAQDAAQRVADLDADLQVRLRFHRETSFVVFHDAFGYFTDHYGLRPAIAVSLGDASTPSAARLAEIRDEIQTADAACAFPEYGSDPKLVQTVIEGTGTRLGGELSPEGGALPEGPQLYGQILEAMASELTDCFSAQ